MPPAVTKEQTSTTAAADVASALTPDEIQFLEKRRSKAAAPKSRAETKRALTGEQADYPSLSHVWSNEVALNLACSVHSRMRTFLWKKFLWQLRVKAAIEQESNKRWKRNPRWLAALTGREVAALWGHLGAAPEDALPSGAASDVKPVPSLLHRPSCGGRRKLKAGVRCGKAVIQELTNLASAKGYWVLLEVFAGWRQAYSSGPGHRELGGVGRGRPERRLGSHLS